MTPEELTNALLKALDETVDFAEIGVRHVNSTLVGTLYPQINFDKILNARKIIREAKQKTEGQ